MTRRLALYNLAAPAGAGHRMFGKDVANLDLFRALIRHGGLERVDLMLTPPRTPAEIGGQLDLSAEETARLAPTGITDWATANTAGTVLRGSALIPALAWQRRATIGDAGASLIGVIHTLGPPAIRADMAEASVAPVQPWDALVCTSPSVQQVAMRLFDGWEAHLAERTGGKAPPRPQLPVIPLGVDGARFAAMADRPEARARLRATLGIGAEDVLLLWVGRLSFFEKAFPQPMMRAAEEAARASGRRVHLAMAGWFPSPAEHEPAYRAAAAAYCPSVPFHLIDGTDPDAVADCWAAADVFVSLVDNIQETFGITPVEAMAAGLPVVVSDWDGYRSTVRDGVEGMLIPTLIGPPGAIPSQLPLTHGVGLTSYQSYAGLIAQHSAVHVGRAAEAIAALANDPDLRRRMGAAGRARVADALDWRVVAPRYVALAEELAAIRRALGRLGQRGAAPLNADPFADFAPFATAVLGYDSRLALRGGAGATDLDRAAGLMLDRVGEGWRADRADCDRILALLAPGPQTVRELLLAYPVEKRRRVQLSLLWLAKIGIVDWLAD